MANDIKERIGQLDLTAREKEILNLVLEGKTSKETAFDLNIDLNTVKFHKKNIYQKINVKNSKELLKLYYPSGNSQAGQTAIKRKVPIKLIVPIAAGVLALVVALVLFSTKAKEQVFIFENWIAIADDISTIQVTRRNEEIDGKMQSTVTIAGMLYNDPEYPRVADGYFGLDMPYSGAYGKPDAETLALLRTAKSFSFSFAGDGARYYMRLPTFETIEGDHWLIIFPTVKGEISSITFNIPADLFRLGWSEKAVEFIQENIMFIQVQPVDPGDYELKFWDIRLYQ